MFFKKKYDFSDDFNHIAKFPTIISAPLLAFINIFLEFLVFTLADDLQVNRIRMKSFDDKLVDLYVVEPKNSNEKLPCFIYCHGGGFIKKAGPRHYKLISEYIRKNHCKIVYVDYRLAPFHKYPIPVKDCFEAYKYVLENADNLNIDLDRIVIGGDSAGGNLAISTTLMIRDNEIDMPKGLMMIYPAVDRLMNTESMRKYTDTPIWNSKLTKKVWKWYLGNIQEVPIYASILENNNLKNLPKTYLEVAEFDCLHDEGVLLKDKLINSGIEVEFYDVKKTIHGFDKELNSEITKECMQKRNIFLNKILNK